MLLLEKKLCISKQYFSMQSLITRLMQKYADLRENDTSILKTCSRRSENWWRGFYCMEKSLEPIDVQ